MLKQIFIEYISIQFEYDSTMCRYVWTALINFILKGENLLDYTNSFSPNNYEKNGKMILIYFQ